MKKNGQTATASNITADATESNQAIINKILKANITLNYSYWNGKSLHDYNYPIQTLLVNEGILNRIEANWVEMENSVVINQGAKDYQVRFGVDNFPPEIWNTATFHVVDDGLSAAGLANKIAGGIFYLQGYLQGQYADSGAVTQDLRQYLTYDNVYDPKFTAKDVQGITLNHVKLNGETKVQANILKDGQTSQSAVTAVTNNYPEIIAQPETANTFNGLVNLSPAVINNLQSYFKTQTDPNLRLQYFYNILDNGKNPLLTQVTMKYFQSWNTLETAIYGYGALPNHTMLRQSDTTDQGNLHFATFLDQQIMAASSSHYLTVFFQWNYAYAATGSTFTTSKWASW